ncbi:hypothetical protein ENBRE01_2835, partial [Enteropsectra breve]
MQSYENHSDDLYKEVELFNSGAEEILCAVAAGEKFLADASIRIKKLEDKMPVLKVDEGLKLQETGEIPCTGRNESSINDKRTQSLEDNDDVIDQNESMKIIDTYNYSADVAKIEYAKIKNDFNRGVDGSTVPLAKGKLAWLPDEDKYLGKQLDELISEFQSKKAKMESFNSKVENLETIRYELNDLVFEGKVSKRQLNEKVKMYMEEIDGVSKIISEDRKYLENIKEKYGNLYKEINIKNEQRKNRTLNKGEVKKPEL